MLTEKNKFPIVIAEIGGNHKGDMNIAFRMIEMLKYYCEIDYVKFQKRCNKELLTEAEYNAPHPHPENSYGKTYGEHREFLEFDIEQHKQLKQHCEKHNIGYACSVWDLTSTKEIVSLNPDYIKIPSACNLKFDIYDYLINNYDKEVHISLGMTTHEEEEKIIRYFEDNDKNKNVILYACVSGYPLQMDQVYLNEIKRLKEKFKYRVKNIGFSGHHVGYTVDMVATTFDISHIERHFTLDRTWKGTDHKASLLPEAMRILNKHVKLINNAVQYKPEEIIDVEWVQRKKLKRF